MAETKILPELSGLGKPYTLPASDPFGLKTQMGAGVPGVPATDTQKIDVKALGKLGSQERLQNIRQQEADLRQQELQAKQQLAESKQKIDEAKAAGQSAITTQEGERAKTIYQSVEDFREKNPAPELVPTKENIQSLSTLFGLIGVIGMALGGSGKNSAMLSLNAMTGMMKGWQQGRADLWKREVQEFDKNMLAWKAKLDDAIKKSEAAYKILPYNRAEAESRLNEILVSMGSTLLQEQNKVQGFEPTFKNLESLAKDADAAIKESGVERRHRETMAKSDRQYELQERRLALAEKREELKEKKQTDTGEIPKDAKTKEEYRARYEIVKNIEDIQSLLEDPKYSKLITPATKFTPDVISNLQKNYPELSQKLARIQAIEFQIGGKALTAKEQEILSPIYGWKGLTADALKSRISGVKDSLQETNELTEVFYPGLKRVKQGFDSVYEQRGKVPEVPSAGGGDIENEAKKRFGSYEPDKYDYGYENGKFYRDKK